ncbi:MAG: hypothetical protein ACO1TE_23690 [Prosthecobacter sp.]
MLLIQKSVPSLPRLVLGRILAFIPRWLRWSTAAVSLVMPVLAFTHGHEFKQAVKAAWSRWDVRRAKPLLQNEITAQDGVTLLVGALMRTPDEPDVIRSLAQLTDEAGMPVHARFFYEHLSRRDAMTADDRLRHAAMLARLNDRTGAQIVLRQFAATEGETPALWRTQAEIATGNGDHTAAREALGKVLAKAPQDDTTSTPMQHAREQALSTEDVHQRAGMDKLLDLFEKSLTDYDATQRTQCFWTLAGMTLPQAAQRERFAGLIERMPWKKLERRVMQRLLQATLDPGGVQSDKLRDWMREMFVREAGAPADERLAIAKMLQRHELNYLVLEWIPFELGLQDRALCAARLDSLNAVQLWTQSSAMIEHPACPLPDELRAIMRAHLELVTTGGKTLRSGVLLHDALTAARQVNSQGSFVAIATLAARFAHHEVALSAYGEAMAPRFPAALFLAPAFIEEARRSGGSAEVVLKHLQKRVHEEAWNQDLQRQVRYYRVLCGDSLELIEMEAAQSRREHPEDVYSAFLVSFARLRLGQKPDVLSDLPVLAKPHGWTTGESAVLKAIFLAAGHSAPVSFEQGAAPEAALFKEERRLCFSRGD